MSKEKFLWVGSFPPPYSGVEVLQSEIKKVWDRNKVKYHLINVSKHRPNRIRGKLYPINFIYGLRDLIIIFFAFMKPIKRVYFCQLFGSRLAFWREFPIKFWGRVLHKKMYAHHQIQSNSWLSFYNKFSFLEKRMIDWTVNSLSGLIVDNLLVQQELSKLYPKVKIHFLPNGIDTDFLKPEKIRKKYDFIFMSSLSKSKGIIIFFKALQNISVDFKKSIRVVLIGENWLGKEVFGKWLSALRNKKIEIQWIKEAGRNQKRKKLGQSRFLVAPSLSDSCPLVVLEALSCGVPVISTKVGMVEYFNLGSKDGIFLTEKNPRYLRKIMLKALRLSFQSEKILSQNARSLIKRKKLDIKIVAEKLKNIILE